MFSSAEEVLRFIAEESVEFVDVRFCDLPGTMQHFTVPAASFGEGVFTDGLMFDGSSAEIRGTYYGRRAGYRPGHPRLAYPPHGAWRARQPARRKFHGAERIPW